MSTVALPAWLRAVVFDLDGTLVDSAPDLRTAINTLLAADGLAPYDVAEVRGFIGNGITRLVELAYETRETPLAGAALEAKVATYKATYQARIAVDTRAYPGALDLVDALRAQNIKVGICTNKAETLTTALLDGLGLAGRFDAVVGGSSALPAKPAVDMLLETLARLGATPETAVMVGDSENDIACARAAGVPTVGVTFGYTKTPMRDLGPDAVVDHLADVPGAIATLRRTNNAATQRASTKVGVA